MPEPKHRLTPENSPNLVAEGVSLELAPAQAAGFLPLETAFPEGSRVFLTHLEGKPLALQVEAARQLRQAGFVPVPHFGARHFASPKEFVDLVGAHSRNGVTEALFVGGNPLAANGPLEDAADLLAHPVIADSTIRTAFIGGYPEGHPAIGRSALAHALLRKIAICHDRDLAPRIVSQFAFDGAMMAAWTNDLHRAYPGIPVHLGVAGVTSLTKLIKFAMMCGVGPSLAALRRSGVGLFNVLADKDPGDLVEAIETGLASNCGAQTFLHIFPFGGWEKSLSWLEEFRRRRAN